MPVEIENVSVNVCAGARVGFNSVAVGMVSATGMLIVVDKTVTDSNFAVFGDPRILGILNANSLSTKAVDLYVGDLHIDTPENTDSNGVHVLLFVRRPEYTKARNPDVVARRPTSLVT